MRYNVCVDNGRSPKLARRQGDIYVSTWAGGALDGALIYNNTIYWNPPLDVLAENLRHDWHLGAIELLTRSAARRAHALLNVDRRPTAILVSPAGQIVRRWTQFVTPAELGLTVRHYLGAPAGSPALDVRN